MKYQEWLKVWLEHYIQPTAKSKTYEHYKYLSETHIAPHIGEMDMTEITTINLQKLVSELLREGNKVSGKGLSSNTVNTIITVMQSSFRTAQNVGEVTDNPTEKIKRPKKEEKRVECFTVNEQKKIEDLVLEHKKPKMFGILICLYTGLRIGEVLALEWSDIDFEKGLLSVNKSCRDNKNGKGEKRLVGTPKTNTSRRVIPLPKQLIPLLKKHKARTKTVWVISEKEKPMLYQVVDRIDIYRDRVEIHVNIKMDMYENGLSDRLQAPTTELITVPARIEDNDNLPMVACGADQTVLSGQSIIGGVNSVSLAA